MALFGYAVVMTWAVYYPADSTAVEQGHGLALTLGVMILVGLLAVVFRVRADFRGMRTQCRRASFWIDGSVGLMAGWVFLAAWVTAGSFSFTQPEVGGDLRAATNEAWWWVAAAGLFVVLRRALFEPKRAMAVLGLLLAAGVMLAVHTLHQYFISIPQTLQDFLRDPDARLAEIGMQAEAGSATRMIFENRLRDGGPTATFALANSLAGPLSMSVMLAGGCGSVWLPSEKNSSTRFRLGSVIVVCVLGLLLTALWFTSSRSGFLSVVLVTGGMTLNSFSHRVLRARSSQRGGLASRVFWRNLAIGLGLSAIGFALLLYRYGKTVSEGEWVSQAPATLQIRMQYWASTLSLVRDYPWFGAGPGNFQLVYQKYRDVAAHELIAEPHNFLMETLAGGGFIAAVLLVVALMAGVVEFQTRRRHDLLAPNEAHEQSTEQRPWPVIAVGTGGLVGVLSVWYAGIAGGDLPDFDAHLFALPASGATYLGWCWAVDRGVIAMTRRECRTIAGAMTATGLLHLCFSGGWTVPGVSLYLISAAAIATSLPGGELPKSAPESQATPSTVVTRFGVGLLGVAVIFTAYVFSYVPVVRTDAAILQAKTLITTNRTVAAKAVLRSAISQDPLDKDAAIWLASIENRDSMRLIAGQSSQAAKQRSVADDALDIAARRSNNDPVRLRAIAEQWIERYQVAGKIDDLGNAVELLSRAIELSPANETITAQKAEVVRELQRRGVATEHATAQEWMRRAETLAAAGGVVTRQLSLQRIMTASFLGVRALGNPSWMSAADVLEER